MENFNQSHQGSGDNVLNKTVHITHTSQKGSTPASQSTKWLLFILCLELALGIWGEFAPDDIQETLENFSEAIGMSYTVLWIGVFVLLVLLVSVSLNNSKKKDVFHDEIIAGEVLPEELSTYLRLVSNVYYAQERKMLKSIHTILSKAAKPDRYFSIEGMGGIGKSTAAKYYYQHSKNKKHYGHYLWIDATNGIDKGFTENKSLTSHLKTKDFEQIISILKKFKRLNLLVMDNVGADFQLHKSILPYLPNWHVVCTSRLSLDKRDSFDITKNFDAKVWHKAFIGAYHEQAGTPSLRAHTLPAHIGKEDLNKLREVIGHNMLIWCLIASAMGRDKGRRLSIKTFLEAFEKHQLDQKPLDQLRIRFPEKPEEEITLLQHLKTTFDVLEEKGSIKKLEPAEKNLLGIVALLPDEYIDEQLLAALFPQHTALEFSDTLEQLYEKGWIQKTWQQTKRSFWQKLKKPFAHTAAPEAARYKLHRLIAEALLYQLDISWTMASPIIQHFAPQPRQLISFSFGHFKKVTVILTATLHEAADRAAFATFLYDCGHEFNKHNKIDADTPLFLFQEALKIWRQLVQDYPKTYLAGLAMTLNNLANLHSDKNELAQAESEYEEALKIQRDLAEQNPQTFLPDVAMTLNNLAALHYVKNELAQAESEYEEALKIYRDLAEQNPQTYMPDAATTLNNSGVLHSDKNEQNQAESEYEEALKIYRDLAKVNPQTWLPYVATTLNNLAVLHKDKNELAQAESKYEEALKIYRDLAEQNPQTFLPGVANTLNNLAALHWAKNELAQAESEYEEALKIRRDLAKVNPQTWLPYVATTLNNLAVLHRDKNELAQAESEYQEALKIYRDLAKANPQTFLPNVAMTASNLALFYQQNKPDRARSVALAQEALAAARDFEGFLHEAKKHADRARWVLSAWAAGGEEE